MQMKKSDSRPFWLFNIGSWAIFYTAQGTTTPIFLSFDPYSRFILILTFIFWITLSTSLYRYIYRRFHFEEKSPIFTVIQSIVSALLIWGFDVSVRFYFNSYLVFSVLPEKYRPHFEDNIFAKMFNEWGENPTIMPFFDALEISVQISKLMAIATWIAIYNFYKFYTNAQNARVNRLKIENQLKESELISLRSQLNPHFLFNALNSIHSLTMSNPNKASDAVLLLSDLMRYALNYGKRDLVTVEEEMDMVRKYLELEKIRFGDKLHYDFDIQKETLSGKIPPIIIQTLAENAIKHGVRQTLNGGYIGIKSFLKDNFLQIEINNSGQLKNADPSVSKAKEDGIGIDNTIKRLKMMFGETAFFNIQNKDAQSVVATVKIPVLQ
jgi:hypothetical protein